MEAPQEQKEKIEVITDFFFSITRTHLEDLPHVKMVHARINVGPDEVIQDKVTENPIFDDELAKIRKLYKAMLLTEFDESRDAIKKEILLHIANLLSFIM
ncbi:hypothetical protein [Acidianus manzaensis]|uniref:Uncharacterized protein n=1 Tax=Acidianus manzaensis TaxID=282676 RepID=A0A1W6K1J2_9CREN|nr:hypothetical protein [Acidianus manzaensis]ARM76421.1 hypothetical protein B6F84_10595 [Acidianus manzaensis]